MGSILDALNAGWRLAITETMITVSRYDEKIRGIDVRLQEQALSACPKLKVILDMLMMETERDPDNIADDRSHNAEAESLDHEHAMRIFPGRVPMAAMVPISRIRS